MAKAKEDAAAIMKQKQAACMSFCKPCICLNLHFLQPRRKRQLKRPQKNSGGIKVCLLWLSLLCKHGLGDLRKQRGRVDYDLMLRIDYWWTAFDFTKTWSEQLPTVSLVRDSTLPLC